MHVDAKSVCLELMLQPLLRLIPFFEGPCLGPTMSVQFVLGIPGLLLNPATSHCRPSYKNITCDQHKKSK